MAEAPFGATLSPFLLTATFRHNLASCVNQFPVTAGLLENEFCVNDLKIVVRIAHKVMTVYRQAR